MTHIARKPARYVIDEAQLEEICRTASEAGVKAYMEERKRAEAERQSKVLNSARTLITNYRLFKKMCCLSVYDADTANETELKEILELMNGRFRNNDFEVTSIKEKVVRTRMIMDHVDTMLAAYEQRCRMSNEPEAMRRFRVIKGLYLDEKPKTLQCLSEEEAITVSTVYRDCKKAFKELAVLFFGIDGAHL